jgi:hypothetical protein
MTNIPAGLNRRRVQGGGTQFTTVVTAPAMPYVSFGAYADSNGYQHFNLGACLSLEGNTFRPVLDINMITGVVQILNQTLVVP